MFASSAFVLALAVNAPVVSAFVAPTALSRGLRLGATIEIKAGEALRPAATGAAPAKFLKDFTAPMAIPQVRSGISIEWVELQDARCALGSPVCFLLHFLGGAGNNRTL